MCSLQLTVLLSFTKQSPPPLSARLQDCHSTVTTLLTVTESLGAATASSHSSVLILLDLSSAFDPAVYRILLSTLAELGIADSVLTWFTSYLTNGTFQVTWNDSLFISCFLDTAVPQGLVSGAPLFSIYI